MRQLRVVGLSDDGRQLLLAPGAKSEPTHRVPIDERLRAAARGDLARFGGELPDSTLSPREIQSRLRAGASPEELAKAAGVPVARVERFSGPVVSERARVVDEARAARMNRPRRGVSSLVLGDCVDASLRMVSGLRSETVGWTARRRDDGSWLVVLEYVARGATRRAGWAWDPVARTVTPEDALATRLGYEADPDAASSRPRRTRTPKAASRARPAARKTATRKTATRKTATRKTATRKVATRKAATRKAATRKTATRKVATRKAATRKVATRKTATRKVATRKAVTRKAAKRSAVTPRAKARAVPKKAAAAKKPVTRRAAVTVRKTAARQPRGAKTAAKTTRGRAAGSVPSWDDILLGVTDRRPRRRSS